MKKITLSFSVLAVSAALFSGCGKKVTPTAPVADTELQTSIDASHALFMVTDAEMIGAFISDNTLIPDFYMPSAVSIGSVSPVQNLDAEFISFGFNRTTCLDGRLRDGTVILDRAIDPVLNSNANANSRYYRRFGFSCKLTLSEYTVDGWRIVTTNGDNSVEGQPCVVINKLDAENWNPATTNLTWSIKGNFKIKKGADSMFIHVDLTKTLLNTSDASVFPVNKTNIKWVNATVGYSGKVSGVTFGNVPFNMEILPEQQIKRDFKCFPDKISGVVLGAAGSTTVSPRYEEFHPFITGVASFTTAQLYPRQIYYGGSEYDGEGQCDNSGAVLIKGISYPVDFKK